LPKTLPDLQRVLIANAANQPRLRLLPVPKSLAKNAGAIATSVKSMLAAGLIETTRAQEDDILWSDAKSEERLTLVATSAGLAAIGLEPSEAAKAKTEVPAKANHHAASPRAKSKLATMIELLNRRDGATLAEIAKVTAWQHHSIRGAISGALKKKLGLNIASDATEGRGRVYRIVPVEKPATIAKAKRKSRQSGTV
jgi:hypothetical protein